MTLRFGEASRTPPTRGSGAFFVVDGPGFATGLANRVHVEVLAGEERWLSVGSGAPHRLDDLEFASAGRCSRGDGAGPLEHLSAGFGIAGLRGWHVRADHPDLPLLDGSAKSWYDAARPHGSGRCPVREAGTLVLPGEPLRNERGGWIEVRPSERFHLDATWSAGAEGPERWTGDRDALTEIVAARTFIDLDVYLAFRAQGQIAGADADSGRLLRGRSDLGHEAAALARELGVDPRSPVWTGGPARMPDECAAHKALDLVGDILLWLGYLPCLEVTAHDAGHALHHRLGAQLRAGLA